MNNLVQTGYQAKPDRHAKKQKGEKHNPRPQDNIFLLTFPAPILQKSLTARRRRRVGLAGGCSSHAETDILLVARARMNGNSSAETEITVLRGRARPLGRRARGEDARERGGIE